jgi:hypothetical protein
LNEADGFFDLRTNGLPEAAILPQGAAPVGQTQQWLTALPLVARPAAKSMLLIGFGGGVALENAPATLETIDVVELEPAVIAANRSIGGLRLNDPLQDDRIRIVFNDARNALRLSNRKFDIIVSQPSHPWTAGASHLFSREFFELARSRMNENGVFLQWMSAGFVDSDLLRSLTATLVDTFGNVRLYQPAPAVLLFLAADEALALESNLAASGRPIVDNPIYFSLLRLNGLSDLAATLMLDAGAAREFAAAAPLSTDDRNRMATDSAALANGMTAEDLNEFLADYDPLADRGSPLRTEFGAQIDLVYVASRLIADGHVRRAERLGAAIADPATRDIVAGLVAGQSQTPDDARSLFLQALALDSENQTARYALVQPALAALATGRGSSEVRQLAAQLTGSAAAVVEGWRLAAEESWPALAALDRELAQARVTDLWFADASQLRAEWRSRVADDGTAPRAAIRIIDRALTVRPTLDLLVLRAAAADAVGDAAAYVESTRYALQQVQTELDQIESGSRSSSRTELGQQFAHLRNLRTRLVRLPEAGEKETALSDRIGVELGRIQVLLR